ncbi:MAG: 4a-hydroxytetrahydrobiopterin dehydratase [Calditrichia bacterium]
MQKLSPEEICERVDKLEGWHIDKEAIKKEWQFAGFKEAVQFINKVADLAEEQDHHPEIFNVYNKVSLRYSTHDAGGITERDFKAAAAVNKI